MWEGLTSESAVTFKYNCLESGKSFDEALLNQVSLDCQFRTTCCRVHYPCNTVQVIVKLIELEWLITMETLPCLLDELVKGLCVTIPATNTTQTYSRCSQGNSYYQ